MTSWEARRSTAKRSAAAAAIAEVQPKTRQRRWHMREPAGFDESWQQYLQPLPSSLHQSFQSALARPRLVPLPRLAFGPPQRALPGAVALVGHAAAGT